MDITITKIEEYNKESCVTINIHDPENPYLQLLNFALDETDITKDLKLQCVAKTKQINDETKRKEWLKATTEEIHETGLDAYFKKYFTTGKREKMSKSKGNVITIDEVAYGVADLNDKYEFRDVNGNIIDHVKFGVWRDRSNTSFFFTSTRFEKMPVYLCEKDNSEPCLLEINGRVNTQHAQIH